MSRSGYSDDLTPWALIKWRGQVASALRGKRGQALLRDLVAALDAMPSKRLITEELVAADGEVCALGAVGVKRQVDMTDLDPYCHDTVAEEFDVAPQLAQEIMYMNDEYPQWPKETPEQRWNRMRAWAIEHLKPLGEPSP